MPEPAERMDAVRGAMTDSLADLRSVEVELTGERGEGGLGGELGALLKAVDPLEGIDPALAESDPPRALYESLVRELDEFVGAAKERLEERVPTAVRLGREFARGVADA